MSAFTATVALHRWEQLGEVELVLQRCFADLGGVERFVRPGQMVVIKPNITANAPTASGGTTHVELVEALVCLAQRAGAGRIIVAEGTGAFGLEHETAFPTGGWREMAARRGVELYNLDHGPHLERTVAQPHYPHSLPFSQLVLEADVFITVPCLKTHISCDYTVALKNSYGLVPQWKRSEIHSQGLLEEALADINRIRKPDLTIVDGYDGSEGIAGGSSFDHPAGARLMLVGADPVAVDVVSRELMHRTYPTRYLKWAIEAGLGEGKLERIAIAGEPLAACQHAFLSPAEEVCHMAPGLTIHDQVACSGCRSATLSALGRLRHQQLKKPLRVIYGGQGEAPCLIDNQTLIVGNCANAYARQYPGVGVAVEGCPAKVDAIMRALEELEVVCHKCRDLAQKTLAELPDDFKAHLRVTASGSEVYRGSLAPRDQWHLELLVGKCMRHFAYSVRERAPQFGMAPERDVIFLDECPVPEEHLCAALERLEEVVREVAR